MTTTVFTKENNYNASIKRIKTNNINEILFEKKENWMFFNGMELDDDYIGAPMEIPVMEGPKIKTEATKNNIKVYYSKEIKEGVYYILIKTGDGYTPKRMTYSHKTLLDFDRAEKIKRMKV